MKVGDEFKFQEAPNMNYVGVEFLPFSFQVLVHFCKIWQVFFHAPSRSAQRIHIIHPEEKGDGTRTTDRTHMLEKYAW